MVQERFLIPDSIEDVHNKYFIQEGDTFKSVALDLGIEWQILRTYHNTHCINEADMVHAYFPNHLKFIFLQPKHSRIESPKLSLLKKRFSQTVLAYLFNS